MQTSGASDEPRFCVRCGTALNGPFCHACGAAAQGPKEPLPAAERYTTRAPGLTVRWRPALPALPPFPVYDAASLDVALFAAASAAIGFIMLAFPALGLLAGFAAFILLGSQFRQQPSEQPDESSAHPGSSAS